MKTLATNKKTESTDLRNETRNAAAMVASYNREELQNLAPITDEIAHGLGFQVEIVSGDNRVRAFYYYRDENGNDRRNSKGERLLIEISHCTDSKSKNSLPALWYKSGYTPERLATYLCIHTFVENEAGDCYGRYNPQEKLSEDRKRMVIDFKYMLPATAANFEKLLKETRRRFEAAK